MKLLTRIYLLTGLILIVLLSGCQETQKEQTAQPATEVGVHMVSSQPVILSIELPGRVTAFRTAEVRPQVNGIVLKRKFEEGAFVSEGEELYEIDSAIYQASYDKAMANRNNLERAANRKAHLNDTRSLSDQDYENALYAWEQAKADAELARLNLEYCRIKAPLSGKIGRSKITEGALVTNGQPQALAVIQQIDPIFVDLNPAMVQLLKANRAKDLGLLEIGDLTDTKVIITLEDDTEYPLPGKIKFLDNSVDQGTGTVALRAEFPNPEGKLLPGMFIRARVQEGVNPEGILVPQQALFRNSAGEAQVWLVKADQTVEMRKVETDRTIGNTWLIKSGLEPGDQIVTEGLQNMAQGLLVAPQTAVNVDIKQAFTANSSFN